jgi:hypothetical protein
LLLNKLFIISSIFSAILVVLATLYAFQACLTHLTIQALLQKIISIAAGHSVGAASNILHIQLPKVQAAFSNAQASLLYTFKFASSSTTSYHHNVACFHSSITSQALSNIQFAELSTAHTNSAVDDNMFHFFNASILSQKLDLIAALAILSSACHSNLTIQLANSLIQASSNVL